MRKGKYTVSQMRHRVGSELGVSDWLLVDQASIDQFSSSTKDDEWLHVDPERARLESPYGGTIAFGFWTLAMLTYCSQQLGMWPKDVAYGINYGMDRVRWLHPVLVGTRIRMRCSLMAIEDRPENRLLIKTSNVMEIENCDKPAMVADWIGMFVIKGN